MTQTVTVLGSHTIMTICHCVWCYTEASKHLFHSLTQNLLLKPVSVKWNSFTSSHREVTAFIT